MSVKFIFKAIIGTIAIIIVSCLVIELFNVFVVTNQLQMMQRVAARQACVLFSQETFKREDTELQIEPIVSSTSTIITNDIYDAGVGADADAVYASLFTNNKSAIEDYLTELGISSVDNIPWSSFRSWYKALDGDSDIYGELYLDSHVTPSNMGITYLDRDVVNRIYRWNLATILKNNSTAASGKSNIGVEGTHGYVDYRGFRIWLGEDDTQIPNDKTDVDSHITYKLYNLADDDDKNEFESITHIGEDGEQDSSLVDLVTGDERNYVVVASVPYTCKVSYRGITPLRHIINFVTNRRVAGYNEATPTQGTSDIGTIGDYADASELNQKGGITSGSIKYYVIR